MQRDLSAVVLAGVHDWGACVLNQAILRPLAPIANRPMIEHVLAALARTGVTRVVICANGQGGPLCDALGTYSIGGMHLSYLDDTMPRGPAGCIKDAAAGLGESDIIAMEASALPYFDLDTLVDRHRRSNAALTIAASRSTTTDQNTYAPIGTYLVSAKALRCVPERGFFDIKEGLVPKLHQAGQRVDVCTVDGMAPHLQGMSSYFALNDWAVQLAEDGGWGLDGYAREGDAIIHIDARIDVSVRLLGPVIIGPAAALKRDAIVVGPASIDREAVIGAHAVVSRSAVWTGARVADHAQIDRCVVTCGARVAERTELFNAVCMTQNDERGYGGRNLPFAARDKDKAPIAADPVGATST